MEAVLVGRPNAGKSLFLINFADYLGLRGLEGGPYGHRRLRGGGLSELRRKFVSPVPNRVREPLAATVSLSVGSAGGISLVLRDTVGIPAHVVPEGEIRRAVAQGLAQLLQATFIFHLIDVSPHAAPTPAEEAVDRELHLLAQQIAPSLILANKAEADLGGTRVRRLKELYGATAVLPVSALTRLGFRDVKHWLVEQLALEPP
jgi:predicted GTPase